MLERMLSDGAAAVRALVAVAVLAVALPAGGCAAYTRDLQPPRVALAAVELTELGLRVQRFRVTLDLANPNDVALPVDRLDYEIDLIGEPLVQGWSEQGFRIPARGNERVSLMVSTDMLRSADQLLRILDQGSGKPLDYHVHGRLRLDLPLRPSLRFSERGEVPLTR